MQRASLVLFVEVISPFSSRSYRFTLDDLYPMMTAVKHRAELYDDWASRVAETLDARLEKKKGEDTPALADLPFSVTIFLFPQGCVEFDIKS